MNDLMRKVQEALERDLSHKARGHVFSEVDYLRAQEVIDAAIKQKITGKVAAEVEQRTRAIAEERAQFQKKLNALQAEYDWLLPYAQAKQRVAEKQERAGTAARTSFNAS